MKEIAGKLLEEPYFAVDGAAVGKLVLDEIRWAKIRDKHVYELAITSGDTCTQEGSLYRAPKRDLVSTVAPRLQSGMLEIAKGLKNAPVLERELRRFRTKVSNSAPETYEAWWEGANDDIVGAVVIVG
ncbi:MAG: hypothetical protein ACRD16_16860 [Thermoanaerobaculia bacterium]